MDKTKPKLPLSIAVGLLVLITLFIINGFGSTGLFGGGEDPADPVKTEGNLEEVLSEIIGVGEVKLFFYYGDKQQGASNSNGKTSGDFLSNYFSGNQSNSSKEEALIGLLVVAEGADDIQIKKQLTDILTRVLQLPEHRIVIVPKKKKGDFQ